MKGQSTSAVAIVDGKEGEERRGEERKEKEEEKERRGEAEDLLRPA